MELSNIVAPEAKASSRNKNNKAGVVTIVSKSGSIHCILISLQLAQLLGLEEKVAVGFMKDEKKLILGKHIPGISGNEFNLNNRMSKGKCVKKVIYSVSLTTEVADMFEIDFSHKTSETLYKLNTDKISGNLIAIIER